MLIVPNLLNIPQLVVGAGTASSVIGVAMHYSSRAAKSRYCSLHTACFALRRGIPEAVLRTNAFNEEQAVAVDAALRLSSMPSTMTRGCRDLLYEVHTRDDVEWYELLATVATPKLGKERRSCTGCVLASDCNFTFPFSHAPVVVLRVALYRIVSAIWYVPTPATAGKQRDVVFHLG